MTVRRTAAIVLAAGMSTRYGTEDKLWQLFEGKPLISHTLSTLRSVELEDVAVVLQPECREGAKLATQFNMRFVENVDYRDGMSTSLRTGIDALDPSIHSAFVILADMPRVQATTYRALHTACLNDTNADAYAPVYNRRRGNPVLFSQSAFPHLVNLSSDIGARTILSDGTLRVRDVSCCDPGIFFDVDECVDLPAEKTIGA